MKCIVPIAGPDYFKNGNVKGLIRTTDGPLLKSVLDSRYWRNILKSDDYIFILYDCDLSRRFADDYLAKWFPGCSLAFINRYTKGAAISILPALSMINDHNNEELIIDLADIKFSTDSNPFQYFHQMDIGAVYYYFTNSNPAYSYLLLDSDNNIVKAAEKRVISNNASAGVYCFRSANLYLRALIHSLDNESEFTFNGLHYVCPLVNGIVALEIRSYALPVTNVEDVKLST